MATQRNGVSRLALVLSMLAAAASGCGGSSAGSSTTVGDAAGVADAGMDAHAPTGDAGGNHGADVLGDTSTTPPDAGSAGDGAASDTGPPADAADVGADAADAMGDASGPPDATDAGAPDGADGDAATPPDGGESGDTAQPGPDASPTPDGSEGDATMPPEQQDVVECDNPHPLPAGAPCVETPGTGALVVLRGTVLSQGKAYHDGEVVIDGDTIACAGCDCAASVPGYDQATRIDCAQGIIAAGLINPHDHITFSLAWPAGHGDERYHHRHEWRKGKNLHAAVKVKGNGTPLGTAWGEIRMVMSGVTSGLLAGGHEGFVRNLDRKDLKEGLSMPKVELDTFPLGDSKGTMVPEGCDAYDINPNFDPSQEFAYVPHVAEGDDWNARNEYLCLDAGEPGAVDWLGGNSAIIHGIALTAVDAGRMAQQGIGLIWSPRSNLSLYGETAPVVMLRNAGVRIALGSDWTASGSMNMLRELRCAWTFNNLYLGGAFTARDVYEMATRNAAEMIGYGDVIGDLAPNYVADVAIYRAAPNANWRGVLNAGVDDVLLVLRGGTPLYGDTALVEDYPEGVAPGDCEPLDVCGESRSLCTPRELGMSLADLQAALASKNPYPLFFCDTPQDEPTCTPMRPGAFDGIPTEDDHDADGIPDVLDLCPATFDPLRPVDWWRQPDLDGDGIGDACDPCPFDAQGCEPLDAGDWDRDGIANDADDCPAAADPGQEDSDGDGIGDACDPCPDFFNGASMGCPTTVWDVRRDMLPLFTPVVVQHVVVTAVGTQGFFVQHPPGEPDWQGYEQSGIYVFGPQTASAVERGELITLAGQTNAFYGELQLQDAKLLAIEDQGQEIAPNPVDPADVATGGVLADLLEGVLVEVHDVVVEAIEPPTPESAPTGEFQVTGGLLVDDFFYKLDPFPVVGSTFSRLAGVLRWSWSNTKVEPRDAGDVEAGPPGLVDFGPNLVYATEYTQGSTEPPLVVTLAGPAPPGGVFVPIASANIHVARVPGGGVTVPEGADHTEVTVETGPAQADPVELTATLFGTTLSASVRVVGQQEQPALASLEPSDVTVAAGQPAVFTATLTLPAGPGGVTLSITLSPSLGAVAESPANVTVPEGETTATFEVVSDEPAEGTVTVSDGNTSLTASLHVLGAAPLGLVLDEVLYDVPGSDDGYEWIKLYNGTDQPIDLSGWSIGWGGNDYTWGVLQLQGTVPAGGCFLLGGPSASADNGNPVFDWAVNLEPDLQNSGSKADGIALFNVPAAQVTPSTVPVDAVVYGGSNANNLLGPDGQPSPVHVADAPAGQSLLRESADTWTINPTPNSVACPVPLP